MNKRMTVTMDVAVYEGLVRVLGDDLSAGYRAMGQDTAREQEALAWSEALLGDAGINGGQIPINSIGDHPRSL